MNGWPTQATPQSHLINASKILLSSCPSLLQNLPWPTHGCAMKSTLLHRYLSVCCDLHIPPLQACFLLLPTWQWPFQSCPLHICSSYGVTPLPASAYLVKSHPVFKVGLKSYLFVKLCQHLYYFLYCFSLSLDRNSSSLICFIVRSLYRSPFER